MVASALGPMWYFPQAGGWLIKPASAWIARVYQDAYFIAAKLPHDVVSVAAGHALDEPEIAMGWASSARSEMVRMAANAWHSQADLGHGGALHLHGSTSWPAAKRSPVREHLRRGDEAVATGHQEFGAGAADGFYQGDVQALLRWPGGGAPGQLRPKALIAGQAHAGVARGTSQRSNRGDTSMSCRRNRAPPPHHPPRTPSPTPPARHR